MAVGHTPVKEFSDWYIRYDVDDRDGALVNFTLKPHSLELSRCFDKYKREMDIRVANYENLILQVDAQVVDTQPDLPNVSSGDMAGNIRRIARNLVQHTPNCEVVSVHDDETPAGVFVQQTLKSKIIGDDQYSNDMQQNLFASTKNSLTLGFDAVIPALLQDAAGSWYMKYDNIFYRDVFPEPGAKDIRQATDCFVRRYLTKGEVIALVRSQPAGWDVAALKGLLKSPPPNRQRESVDHQNSKHHSIPEGYEIITYYTSSGDPFLTFSATNKTLLRIEQNKDPLKRLPVFFLVLEKDLNQPLGKSQVELAYGRQAFQDLMLNGAMKQWYRNINPAIIGYGTVNAVPNLSPGKITNISNPQARLEPFEVSTQTLLQYGTISQQNAANMIQLVGAADQQMASQSTGGMMSQTPQGVEAQQAMVDITTNNYQKAIESFFSQYCSYALTVFFYELKGTAGKIKPTADTRKQMINAGLTAENFDEDGALKDVDFDALATQYWVRVVPGSLVEMEDEKQLRILNQLFVPLSQAMPAIAASQDQQALKRATAAMMFIIEREITLSGSAHSADLAKLWKGQMDGETPVATAVDNTAAVDARLSEFDAQRLEETRQWGELVTGMQEQIALMREAQQHIMTQLGIPSPESGGQAAITPPPEQ